MASALFAAGFLLAVGIWLVAGDGAWGPDRVSVEIVEARIDPSSDSLELLNNSCQAASKASVTSTSKILEVEVTAFVYRQGGPECQDLLTVSLPAAVRDPYPTELLDRHTGQTVDIQIAQE